METAERRGAPGSVPATAFQGRHPADAEAKTSIPWWYEQKRSALPNDPANIGAPVREQLGCVERKAGDGRSGRKKPLNCATNPDSGCRPWMLVRSHSQRQRAREGIGFATALTA